MIKVSLPNKSIKVKLVHKAISDLASAGSKPSFISLKSDFASSIIDGRLLEQIKQLKQNFEKPLVIVEGETDIFSARNIHPNAIRGMLATIAISYSIPVLFTKNPKDQSFIKD